MTRSPTSVVVIDAFDNVATLDPHKAFDTASRHPILNIYDGLLGFDQAGQAYPVLAEALPIIERRGHEWGVMIPVHTAVQFHDGSELTVEDVVYSLRRNMITADGPASLWSDPLLGRPLSKLSLAAAEEMVRRIDVSADGVLMRLPRPFRPLEALLVQWSLVVSRAWCAARSEWDGDPASVSRFLRRQATALDTEANGTGLYRLGKWDRQRRELRFHRTAGVPEESDAFAQTVVLRSVDDRMVRERELLDGHCDFSVCQPESRARLGEHNGVVLEKLPDEWSINPLGFITQRLDPECYAVGNGTWGPDGLPPNAFSDVHMRRMLMLCFDHERYTAQVLDGEGIAHLAPFPAPALPEVTAPRLAVDIDAARAEFAKAWDGRAAKEGCRITIYTHAANVSREKAAEFLAEGLNAVSHRIKVEIVALDITSLGQMIYASECPVAWGGWASDFLHPYAFASALADPGAMLPTALGIDDPALATLMAAVREADPASEADIYTQMAYRAIEQALFLAPPGKVSYLTFSDRWHGVTLKNHVPNVLDFGSFRHRSGRQETS